MRSPMMNDATTLISAHALSGPIPCTMHLYPGGLHCFMASDSWSRQLLAPQQPATQGILAASAAPELNPQEHVTEATRAG